jgi:hypothetical protein
MGSQKPVEGHAAGRPVSGRLGLLDLLCIEPVAHELCGWMRSGRGGLNALRATCKAVRDAVDAQVCFVRWCGRRTEEAWDTMRGSCQPGGCTAVMR